MEYPSAFKDFKVENNFISYFVAFVTDDNKLKLVIK